MKNKTNEEIEELNWKNILDKVDVECNSCEVLYNMGDQEVIKKDGKYFLSSTFNSNIFKEITRDDALELESIYDLKNKCKSDNFFKE